MPSAIVEDLCDAQIPLHNRLMLKIVKELVAEHTATACRLGVSQIDAAARAIVCFSDGPRDSPYEGRIFYLRMFVAENFPYKPPVCQLLTKIYHPNFDSRGRVCLDLLYKEWTPVHFLYGPLVGIASLLDDPSASDPLVSEIVAQYVRDRATYNKIAREYTIRYATAKFLMCLYSTAIDHAGRRSKFHHNQSYHISAKASLLWRC